MWKYVVRFSYLGTDFCGWQIQRISQNTDLPSIQCTIEKALTQICSEPIRVIGSGRTDSGVHSVGQVAHFVIRRRLWDAHILQKALNSVLPRSICALELHGLDPINSNFHAQRSAVKKQYSYYYQQGSCALPHLAPYSWWIRKKLDLPAMQVALQSLIGEHDFKVFQASGAKAGPTTRTIFEAEVLRERLSFPGWDLEQVFLVRMRLIGSGFLKQMVRGIAGTLLQVGENRRASDCFQNILARQKRSEVGPTAPARGLWQEKVWYGAQDNVLGLSKQLHGISR